MPTSASRRSACGWRIASFDIGIALIDDIPFNRARSDVKVKEYAAAGVPWLASPIGPYAGLGEKQGGRLVADDDWFAALDRLVRKERERHKLAKRAASWAREESLERNLHRWEAVMVEAAELARRGRRGPDDTVPTGQRPTGSEMLAPCAWGWSRTYSRSTPSTEPFRWAS